MTTKLIMVPGGVHILEIPAGVTIHQAILAADSQKDMDPRKRYLYRLDGKAAFHNTVIPTDTARIMLSLGTRGSGPFGPVCNVEIAPERDLYGMRGNMLHQIENRQDCFGDPADDEHLARAQELLQEVDAELARRASDEQDRTLTPPIAGYGIQVDGELVWAQVGHYPAMAKLARARYYPPESQLVFWTMLIQGKPAVTHLVEPETVSALQNMLVHTMSPTTVLDPRSAT